MEPASTINVAITAIQDEYLVLETLDDKKLIYWPLKNLSQTLKVGNHLVLELKDGVPDKLLATAGSSDGASDRKPAHEMVQSSEERDKQARLCKMLEDLVN